jgi:PKD repeat protein
MKTHNILRSAVLAAAIAAVLSNPANSFAGELFTDTSSTAYQAAQSKSLKETLTQVSNASVQPQLAGKNFVQELNKNGDVKRTIITGDAGDGTDAPTISDAAPVVDVPVDKTTLSTPLPHSLQGQDAVLFLGNDFNKVAADNNVTPEKLREILNDPTMHLDTVTGKIFVIDSNINEHAIPQDGVVVMPAVTPTTMLKAPPLTDVFKLHSNPGASKVIYIDFNGQLIQNSAWSSTDINAPAYDLSGDPAVFDDNERVNIYSIWARVTEDYLPFDVDITTEEPTAAALAKTSSTDNNYGTRVVVTKAGTISCNCGGVAYVGIVNYINAQAYQPAWVFQQSLANNEKYIAEAISHEAGHTLGLFHDGNNTTGYYLGHGTGVTSWAPIMGAGYYKNVTQWSAGVYPNANNQQDDLAIFAASGFPARKDDYGNTIATSGTPAITAAGTINNLHAFGIIETNTDKDMFVIKTGGQINLAIAPAIIGANLDISALLTDAQGKVVATSNPVDLLTANINATVAPGTYYLTIAGAGRAAITSNPGYPAYASLGQYEITGTVTGIPPIPPVAGISVFNTTGIAPFTVNFASDTSVGNGAITGFAWNFEAGSASIEANPVYTFTKVGTFPVSLTITNEFGLTSTSIVNITVQPAPVTTVFRVKAINIAVSSMPLRGIASVAVYDINGVAVPNATVSGTWSGYFTGTVSGISNRRGLVTIISNTLSSKAPKTGTATFTVTSIVLNGYKYDATKNAVTIKTITR